MTSPKPDADPGDRTTAGTTRNRAVHNPKGIGSNVLLTAAAAVVPLVIVGIAGLKTALQMRRKT